MTPKAATTAAITPILFNVNTILTSALDQAKLLDGQSADVVMLSTDGKTELNIDEASDIVANFLIVSRSGCSLLVVRQSNRAVNSLSLVT